MNFQVFDHRDESRYGTILQPPYYFGAYSSRIPILTNPFADVAFLLHSVELHKNLSSPDFMNSYANYFLVATILNRLSARPSLKILDVGGGIGDNFQCISSNIALQRDAIEYTIVDNDHLCRLGESFYKNKRLKPLFRNKIPRDRYDFSCIIGTLQYINEWEAFIDDVASLTTDTIFISRTPVRDQGQSFFTVQSICPAFGPFSYRKIGEAAVNIFSEVTLDRKLLDAGFALERISSRTDYSSAFSRLPIDYRNIFYVDRCYRRVADTEASLRTHSYGCPPEIK